MRTNPVVGEKVSLRTNQEAATENVGKIFLSVGVNVSLPPTSAPSLVVLNQSSRNPNVCSINVTKLTFSAETF